MSKSTEFGKWLTTEMRKLRHTDRTFAEEFPTGVTHTTIGRWRRGEAEPTRKHVDEIARILNVETRWIYALLRWITPEDGEELDDAQRYVIEAVSSRLYAGEVRLLRAVVDGLLGQR